MSYRTSFTQNFLHSQKLVDDLVADSGIDSNDTVYDIGAGRGIITTSLIPLAKKIIAIEPDEKYTEILRQKFSDYTSVEIQNQDFLELILLKEPFKIFSNIPFSITTEILRKICFETSYFTKGYLVLDENALNKTMLFICIHNLYDTEIVFRFLPSDFQPKPSIKTVLLELVKKPAPDVENTNLFNDFISACFQTNQPDITSCLKKIFTSSQALRLCKDNKIQGFTKHSQIPQDTWYRLFDFYQKNQNIIPTKVEGSFQKQYQLQQSLKQRQDQV